MSDIPSKLILVCTVSGKQVTWTNKNIIAAKIQQFGSLEAFRAQFKCKGAVKRVPVEKSWGGQPIIPTTTPDVVQEVLEPSMLKKLLIEGTQLAGLDKYDVWQDGKYIRTTITTDKAGTKCTVTAPVPLSKLKDELRVGQTVPVLGYNPNPVTVQA